MARYRITTLVDITRTNIHRSEQDQIKIGQQANFNSLIQAIGLRSNVSWAADPKKYTGRLPEPFDGKGNYWIWEFDVERDDVFLKDNDPVMLLVEDLDGVPIVPQLENTVDITPSVIQTKGDKFNTHVLMI